MKLGDYFVVVNHDDTSGAYEKKRRQHKIWENTETTSATEVQVFKNADRSKYGSHEEFMEGVTKGEVETVASGYSWCSEHDNYNRRKGLQIALNRAFSTINKTARYHKGKGWTLADKK